MPEPITAVFKKDLAVREATDAEQSIINERISKGEPAFEEDREGYVPPKEEGTEDNPEPKSEEKNSEEGGEDQKSEETGDENKGEDETDDFTKADETGKLDLIAELEIEVESEEDEEKKKELQEKLDKWNKTIENPESNVPEEVDIETEIQEYAKEKEISEDVAREVIEGRDNVRKKYGDDPKKLAHALRSIQSEYTKEKKAHTDTAKALEQANLKVIMSGNIKPEEILKKPDGSRLTRDECIDAYRESYPGLTDGKDDDEVYDLQRQHVLRYIQQQEKDSQATVKSDAKAKRVELMANLPKDAEPYKESIKKILDRCPDGAVVQKGFDLEEIILIHKGKDVDNLVKEAEKRGYKRGLERRKIAGEIKSPSGRSKTNKDSSNSNSYDLNDKEKGEALAFYKNDSIPEKRKYELYADMLKHSRDLKKKKEENK